MGEGVEHSVRGVSDLGGNVVSGMGVGVGHSVGIVSDFGSVL